MQIGLFIGDICDAPADVIATSANPQLNLMKGSLASVRQRGGTALVAACEALLEREELRAGQRMLAPGSAPASAAGDLPFQGVIHCIALDSYLNVRDETLASCVSNALLTAISFRPRPARLALPILAADNGKHDLKAALTVMANTLRDEQHKHPLDEIWLAWPQPADAGRIRMILEAHFADVMQPDGTP
jgi:O-acetyl-ADP-ribose deacetylase (regulator of RNase III)